jgi:hypothetical protein
VCVICVCEGEREGEGGRGRCISISSRIPIMLKLNFCNRDVFCTCVHVCDVWDLSILQNTIAS